ncbi:hypothetical protein V6U77_06045 [Micromonospora sp. CPCC 205546]|uniref:hypothetical protein n=1 Tax=Micromonospora sp. CPCC 205546 TaxID=3122397 RepID=UPI002FEF6636
MRPVRPAPLLTTAAAACAAVHVAGILTARPVWRYAEVLAVALLLACAVLGGPRAPGRALPAALAVLLVDAVRTMPAEPDRDGYGWKVSRPGDGIDVSSGVEFALSASWASLAAVVLLLVVWRSGGWRPRPLAAASVAAVLITGYAVIRVVDVWLAVRAEGRWYAIDVGDVVTAVILSVLPPVALGLAALVLAAVLAGHGRRLASAGAVLLALVALPQLDASVGVLSLPLGAGDRTALFAWYAITPTPSMPQPVAALTAAVELLAYLLLVAGLTASPRGARVTPAARS